ncbi:hypothetical protein NF700_05490 [Sphingomonadaceae bacterium OTU29MARTA1]|uniref:hypothetical protein n=1 Tax=Sphingomonas sp. Leaf37 TaxID=2876552 RepID=UPI001E2C3D4A|nr:hypothetical protein [Sphingomonas sp. Leaf37]USU09726.1 hypothetical protein NF700_05490 [Sphingomonadaceae bacterium OTU29MARTA1]USU13158.1 hypothetical protein NF701_04780 [Sphingomonadaceae bacterium OTU29THOMA1]
MARNDREYWARLRVEPRSQWAAGLAVIAGLAVTLAVIGLLVPGNHFESRANPLYWLLMLPLVWWASELMGFEPLAVQIMPWVTSLAPLGSAICLAVAFSIGEPWQIWLVDFIICICASIGSRMTYRDSLLQREGPSR